MAPRKNAKDISKGCKLKDGEKEEIRQEKDTSFELRSSSSSSTEVSKRTRKLNVSKGKRLEKSKESARSTEKKSSSKSSREASKVSNTTRKLTQKKKDLDRQTNRVVEFRNRYNLRSRAAGTSDPVPAEHQIERRQLRPIVIDGSNIAIEHGKDTNSFSIKGIQIVIEYFLKRGHSNVKALIPRYRRKAPDTTSGELLEELVKNQYIHFTPSRVVNKTLIVCDDHRFIVDLASHNDGIIVSNDTFNDLIGEKSRFKEVIESRLLSYVFINDIFMVPEDPMGKNGPSLTEFLSFPREKQDSTSGRVF